MKRLYLLLAMMAIPWLAGCTAISKAMNITPSGQAMQNDFSTNYMETLNEKYQMADPSKGMLKKMVARYDDLGAREDDSDIQQKKEDKVKIAELREKKQSLEYKSNQLAQDIAQLKRILEIQKTEKNSIEANIAKQKPETSLSKLNEQLLGSKISIAESEDKIARAEAERTTQVAYMTEISTDIKALNNKTYDAAENQRKIIRAEITKDFLAIADYSYYNFKTDLLAGRAQSDTLLDITELILSSATTLTGGVMAKTNLGASSTLLKGSRSTVDKNFFAQQTMRAIINAMEDGRSSDKLLILEKLKKSTSDYPLSEAISDVMRYQSRASLFVAILDIANKTGTNADAAASKLVETEKK